MFYRRILDACRARYHIDVMKESTNRKYRKDRYFAMSEAPKTCADFPLLAS